MNTVIQRVSFPDGRRILITSDIHGHADGLRALLKKANFNKNDILIIIGDMVEKGPQSLETIRLAMELQKQYSAYVLMENVDLWRLEFLQSDDPETQKEMLRYSLRAMEWWGGSLLHDLCRELGVDLAADTDIVSLFPEIK
ncbi:MAG: metallophosphoesterase, partial [Clostridia bacterium]|nr:metallophosphoesterase [Clostridia bacterium]